MKNSENKNSNKSLVLTLKVPEESIGGFESWQADLNKALSEFSEFGSQEVVRSGDDTEAIWKILLRFKSEEGLESWSNSESYLHLLEKAEEKFSAEGNTNSNESSDIELQGVTELITIEVEPGMNSSYAKWAARIQKIEASFKGFKGVYLQPPSNGTQNKWVTLLKFDTPQNLDYWLASQKRKDLLAETNEFVVSVDRHRVFSPFAGWFAEASDGSDSPAAWKQTMIVLMVLFPVIMLEIKYLSPITSSLPVSIATFIGNAISVTLVACPLMPVAVKFLKWWLAPEADRPMLSNLKGIALVVSIYMLEIFLLGMLI